jgi:heme/copper-type cytochrome/quinol oxidase subunit 3
MLYCPPNVSLAVYWYEHGLSACLTDTITSICLTINLLLFGAVQLYAYRKYATRNPRELIPKSILYYVQIGAHLTLILLPIAWIIVKSVDYYEKYTDESANLYGHALLRNCVQVC